MHRLTYELTRLCKHNRDGSYATQRNRWNMLQLIGNQLVALGEHQLHATEIKGRHVNKLLAHWKAESLSTGTIENRLAVLRWWCEKVGRGSVMPPTNDRYGLAPRQRIATTSKAQVLTPAILDAITDPYVRLSVELQAAFGLRKEEALKLQPHKADHGLLLVLDPSWTKGGRPRQIPIYTPAQRDVLDRAKAFVGRGHSLIPPDLTYVEQMHRYDYETKKLGLRNLHGLRHAYAQGRFTEMTHLPAPVAGGPAHADLDTAERTLATTARLVVAEELGHSRVSVTHAYLGR